MRRRSFLAFSGAFCAGGCAGSVHRLPQVDGNNLSLAQAEATYAKLQAARPKGS